jgi:hypothetical protein
VPAASAKAVLLAARVDGDTGNKGSKPIFFEIKAQNHEKIVVREKASFYLP